MICVTPLSSSHAYGDVVEVELRALAGECWRAPAGRPEWRTMQPNIQWPDGKRFAFTVFDDTDQTTLANGPEMYRLLDDLGFRTTKSVWPVKGASTPCVGGSTCEDPGYAAWVLGLQDRGFEIALHNVTYHTSTRSEVLAGLEEFRRLFGSYPTVQVNHAGCYDSIYWGPRRLTGLHRLIYSALTRGRTRGMDGGTNNASPSFWGDVCQSRITYVRNFVFSDINTLKQCPHMPYHDVDRPYVNQWFASSEGPDCRAFCRTISAESQDRLEDEGGACVMYTHFGAADFMDGRRLSNEFVRLMTRLANKGGWFVPVSDLLNFIRSQRGEHLLTTGQRLSLETRWLLEKVFLTRGTS